MKVIDFAPAIAKYAVGEYTQFADLSYFKKMKLEDGNIVWGKDWDIIFPVTAIYSGEF
jgi:hypothetical protein